MKEFKGFGFADLLYELWDRVFRNLPSEGDPCGDVHRELVRRFKLSQRSRARLLVGKIRSCAARDDAMHVRAIHFYDREGQKFFGTRAARRYVTARKIEDKYR